MCARVCVRVCLCATGLKYTSTQIQTTQKLRGPDCLGLLHLVLKVLSECVDILACGRDIAPAVLMEGAGEEAGAAPLQKSAERDGS